MGAIIQPRSPRRASRAISWSTDEEVRRKRTWRDTTMGCDRDGRTTRAVPAQRDRAGQSLVDVRRFHLFVLVDQPDHARPLRHVLRLHGPRRPAARRHPALRRARHFPGHHLRDVGERHAAHRRRLCLAEPRLGGGLGFVLSITGWWFTLFLWTPIYANILVVQFFSPLAYTLGWTDVATFFTSKSGIFVSCLIVLAFVSIVVTLGMETYARIQKVCFWIGLAGLAVVCGLLLFSSQSDFQNAFNREATSLFGALPTRTRGPSTLRARHSAGSSFRTFSVRAASPFASLARLLPALAATGARRFMARSAGPRTSASRSGACSAGLWVTVAHGCGRRAPDQQDHRLELLSIGQRAPTGTTCSPCRAQPPRRSRSGPTR